MKYNFYITRCVFMTSKLFKTININDKILALIVVLFNVSVMLLTAFLLVPTAVSNDDYLISMIASGAYGEYSPFVVLTNYFFLYVLNFLQQTIGVYNFLTLFQYLFLLISFCLFGIIFLKKNKNAISFVLYFLFSIVFSVDFFNNLHNTKSAIIIAFIGLVSIFYGTKFNMKTIIVFGCLGTLFSALIRLSAFFMGGLFAFILVLFSVILENDNKSLVALKQKILSFLKQAVPYYIIFTVILAFYVGDRFVYSANPDASFYETYNDARAQLMDYSLAPYAGNETAYSEIGITENDQKLISVWAFSENETFSVETLEAVGKLSSKGFVERIFSSLSEQALMLAVNIPFLLSLLLFVILIFFNKNRKKLLAFPVSIVVSLLLTSGLGRMTPWVLSGLVACSFALLLLLPDIEIKQRFVKLFDAFFVLFAVVNILFAGIYCSNNVGNYKTHYQTQVMDFYSKLNSTGDLYLVDLFSTERIEIQHVVPIFSAVPFNYYQNIYTLGNWDTESPAKNSVLERHGVDGSAYNALLERNDVFLVDVMYYNEKLNYLKENVSETARFSIVEVVDGFFVFGFSDNSPTPTEQGVSISELLVQQSSLLPEFSNVVLKTDSEISTHEMIYLEITNTNDENDRFVYKAKVLNVQDGISVISLDVPYQDFDLFSGSYTANILVEYQDGLVTRGTNDIEFNI